MCAIDVAAFAARPTIGTARLVLRPPSAGDVAELAELANDPGVGRMTTAMPFPYTPADAEGWVDAAGRADPRREASFVVEHRQFGVIGAVVLDEPQAGRPELGYWIGRPFWGRGYATEAAGAALSWVQAGWRRNVVWAGHFADNPASGQVLCKAGFLYTGDIERRTSLARGGAAAPTRMMVWLA